MEDGEEEDEEEDKEEDEVEDGLAEEGDEEEDNPCEEEDGLASVHGPGAVVDLSEEVDSNVQPPAAEEKTICSFVGARGGCCRAWAMPGTTLCRKHTSAPAAAGAPAAAAAPPRIADMAWASPRSRVRTAGVKSPGSQA